MKEEELITTLDRIKKVEVPPFLYTRIQTRIQELATQKYSMRQVLVFAVSISLLIALNATVFFPKSGSSAQGNSEIETVADGLRLTPSNQLYGE